MKRIAASAPTRIDLAGGTVDIWPLYLLTRGAVTVNVAVDLDANCVASTRRDGRLVAVSRDRRARTSRPVLRPVRRGERLELLARLAAEFAPSGGVTLETECTAPAGSGLGGSSSLAIAVATALCRLSRKRPPSRALIEIVRDLETQVLRIPAGEQDYYAAVHGGAQAIEWHPGGPNRVSLKVDLAALRARTVLVDSRETRSSGDSNWDMMRRRIDGDRKTTNAMERIVSAAATLRSALEAGRWKRAGEALAEEMAHRTRMSPKVASGPIAPLLRAGRRAGAWGGKVCGAGGGGFVVFLAPPGRIEEIGLSVERCGGRVVGFQFARRGATVTSNVTSRLTGAQ